MAKLKAKARKKLAKSKFAEPGKRKYPIEDKSHAANAKARASQQEKAGRLSKGEEASIDRKADAVLHRGTEDSRVAATGRRAKAPEGHEHLNSSIHFKS